MQLPIHKASCARCRDSHASGARLIWHEQLPTGSFIVVACKKLQGSYSKFCHTRAQETVSEEAQAAVCISDTCSCNNEHSMAWHGMAWHVQALSISFPPPGIYPLGPFFSWTVHERSHMHGASLCLSIERAYAYPYWQWCSIVSDRRRPCLGHWSCYRSFPLHWLQKLNSCCFCKL